MRRERLEDMVRGWFVGNFSPTLYATNAVEVGVKPYPAGFTEEPHFHKVATEITVIVSGECELNGERFSAGDIVVIEPWETTGFRALSDVTTVVVKMPGANDDKYLGVPEDRETTAC